MPLEQRSHKFQNKFNQMLKQYLSGQCELGNESDFIFITAFLLKKKILTASALQYLS